MWLEYAAGAISLNAASITTETALGLMRVSNEDFVKSYPAYADWWHLQSRFSFDVLSCGKVAYAFPKQVGSTRETLDVASINLLCPATACLLREVVGYMRAFAETPRGKEMLSREGGTFLVPILDPHAYDFAFLLRNQTAELLCWVGNVAMRKVPLQSLERMELFTGIAEYYIHGKLPIWLVIACTIYIDMYEVIGDRPGCAIDAYLDEVAEMEKKVELLRVQFIKDRCGKYYKSLVEVIEPYFGKHLHEWSEVLRSRNRRTAGMPMATSEGSPCWIGLELVLCKWKYHSVGLRIANTDMMVVAMATLYSALKRMGYLRTTWQDIEFVLAQQRSEKPLVPKAGKHFDIRTFLEQYMEVLGAPIARGSAHKVFKKPDHTLVSRHHRLLLGTSDFIDALAESVNLEGVIGFDKADWIETALRQLLADSKSSKVSSKKSKRPKKRKDYTQAELLSTFKENFIKDEPHHNFDYIEFYSTCVRIQVELCKLHPGWSEPGTGISLVPWELVYWLLRDAAVATVTGETPLLVRAAKVMEDIINEPGNSNRFSKQAMNMSSGHISKANRPPSYVQPYQPAFTSELWQKFSSNSKAMKRLSAVTLASANASHLTFYSAEGSSEEFSRLERIATPFWSLWECPLGYLSQMTLREDGTLGTGQEWGSGPSLKLLGRKGYDIPRAMVFSLIDWQRFTNKDFGPGTEEPFPHLETIIRIAHRGASIK